MSSLPSTSTTPAEAALQAENLRLRAVIAAVARINGARDVDAALDAVLDAAKDVFGADRGLILLAAPGSNQRTIRRVRGLSDAYVTHLTSGHVPVQKLIEERGILSVRDMLEAPPIPVPEALLDLIRREGFRGVTAAALQHADQMIGALVMYYSEPHRMSDSDQELARLFAGLAAQALIQAHDFELVNQLRTEREESEQRLQAILDRIRDMVIVWSPEMEVLVANRAATEFLHNIGADADPTVLAKYLPEPSNCPMHQVFRSGMPVVGCEVMIDDQVFAIDCHPLRDEATGDLLAVVEHCREVTANHRLQRELADNERRMRVAMETAPVGILDVLLPGGVIVRANNKFAGFCGRTVEDLLGQSFYHLFAPADRAALEAGWEECRQHGEAVIETVRLPQPGPGGDSLPVSVTFGRFAYSDGELHGHLVIKDVSRRLKLQAQLVEQEKLAAIGELASGVAHELRNPIGIIASALYDLEELIETTDPDILEDLTIARDEIQRVQEIINNVLDFARSSQAEREWVELGQLLNQTAALLRKSLAARDVELALELQPVTEIWAHRGGLRQMALNLITNAYQATPDGGRVSITLEPLDGERVQLSVSDTGPGIAPEVKARIFNPFFTTKAPGQGTGLGLSIVHTIVQDHGGSIDVDSAPGDGATFTVILPRRAEPSPDRDRTTPLVDAADELL